MGRFFVLQRVLDLPIDDCFYAIAVWIKNKRGVIMTAVFGMNPTSSVVFPSRASTLPRKMLSQPRESLRRRQREETFTGHDFAI